MRNSPHIQLQFSPSPIFQITLNVNSRDEVPQLLAGLQFIYSNKTLYFQIMHLMESAFPKSINKRKGRTAMAWWDILVLGLLRLNCKWDYDKLEDQANHHQQIRKALLIEDWEDRCYKRSTIQNNLSLFPPSFFEEINTLIVKEARLQLSPKKQSEVRARCDSFVVESNIHYPTDINLLWDSIRTLVHHTAKWCKHLKISGWRQHKHLLKQFKTQMLCIQRMKHSKSKDPLKKEKKEKRIHQSYQDYIALAESLLTRVQSTLVLCEKQFSSEGLVFQKDFSEKRMKQAKALIDLIERRVIKGEKIPHGDKVFSIFEEYSEWIVKGKAGVSQELGLNVAIVSDQHGFLLHHKVMQHEQDSEVAVELIQQSKSKFPEMTQCSFDKGYWSSQNHTQLTQELEQVILPKKGKRNKVEKERETSTEFKKARNQHSAIESSIAAIENHGLDRCRDRGEKAFKRYIALAVLARNIQMLGRLLQEKEKKKQQRFKSKVS